MFNQSKLLKFCLYVGLVCEVFAAQAITPTEIKKETADYIIDIKYPQGFNSNAVNSVVNNYIVNVQKNFLNELSQDANTPADAAGKTGINVTYSIPYKSKTALSIRFNISIYHRGAAHPSNKVVVQNFVHGKQVNLADLFVPGSSYLLTLADFSANAITEKKISDPDWIKKGTQPTNENYNIWYFTNQGIAIIFDTYQVAAYVYGPQTVAIPLAKISATLKPELAKAVWGK